MKVSDYVAAFLGSKLRHCFGVQGGAVVHLFDSLERIGPEPIYHHHEQAAAFAALGYAQVHGYGACLTTTGPGSTNAITPLLGAFQGSIPMLFISGQQKNNSYGTSARQSASQEAPILEIVERIVKGAYYIDHPNLVEEIFEDAYRESISRRPGPVWIDIVQDVTWQDL